MSTTKNNSSDTNVSEIDIAVEDLLKSAGSSSNILTGPVKEEKKNNFFTAQNKVNDAIVKEALENKDEDPELSDEEKEKLKIAAEEKRKKEEEEKLKGDAILNEVVNNDDNEEELSEEDKRKKAEAKESGRPKESKDVMVKVINKLIEDKVLSPFDDGKDISKYTEQDALELLVENFKKKEAEAWDQVPAKFFESLSPQLQYAMKYELDGGDDMKSVFRLLSQAEEAANLDVKTDKGQEQIIRHYLRETKFGNADEIETQINEWKDNGPEMFEKKANQFKPKLDDINKERMDRHLKNQEKIRLQREESSKKYVNDIVKVLQPGEINGIKLDRKSQEKIYHGLVEPTYQLLDGRPTNLLGHLLEKHQFVEPNHALVAEALLLLSDPEEYRKKVKEMGGKEKTLEVKRKLKTEEENKNSSGTGTSEDDEENKRGIGKTIHRPKNIFARE